MMTEQLVDLSRLQLAATAMYHFIVHPFGISGHAWQAHPRAASR